MKSGEQRAYMAEDAGGYGIVKTALRKIPAPHEGPF
jgi:hypothetical protein